MKCSWIWLFIIAFLSSIGQSGWPFSVRGKIPLHFLRVFWLSSRINRITKSPPCNLIDRREGSKQYTEIAFGNFIFSHARNFSLLSPVTYLSLTSSMRYLTNWWHLVYSTSRKPTRAFHGKNGSRTMETRRWVLEPIQWKIDEWFITKPLRPISDNQTMRRRSFLFFTLVYWRAAYWMSVNH